MCECFEHGFELIEAVVDALTTTSLHQRLVHLTSSNVISYVTAAAAVAAGKLFTQCLVWAFLGKKFFRPM